MESEMFFNEWLKQRRKELGLTQNQLASHLNCSIIHLRKMESGERRPSEQLVEQLVEIFDIPVKERYRFLRYARGEIQVSESNFKGDDLHRIGKSSRGNIPAFATSIIGRDQDLSVLRQYLLDEKIRLVTLIGPPGIGKTRLGLEMAHRSVPDFTEGVFFVPFAPLEKSSQLAPAIFQALGYVESKNQFSIEQLVESIGDKHILVVLDNLEHLIDDSALLASQLLSACSQLKILTTSRESLRVPGEWLYTVSVLDFPKGSNLIDPENVSQFPAMTLFAERAQAVNATFSLSHDNVTAVASICAKLDGVPLAIELIASRIRLYSPQMLWKQLDEHFIMSADGMRSVSARQKTLHNAIQWSYNLLSLEEQELLISLSVFSRFTISAATNMFADIGTEKSPASLVVSFLDKSLIQRLPDANGEEHFGMLMMIQQFALERLRVSGREAEVRDKHLAHFLDLAEQAEREIHGWNQLEWMERIEYDHANFQIALEWSISNHKVEAALCLLGALGWMWWLRGHYSESREWFDRIRILPGAADHPAQYANLLNRIGSQSWNLGDNQDALALLEESQVLWESLGDAGEKGLADCLNWMGMVVFDGGASLRKAGVFIERSITLYQKHGDIVGTAQSMLNAGYVNLAGKPSLEWFEQSLEFFKQAGDIWGMSRVYQCIGRVHLERGDDEKARWCFEQQMIMDGSLHYVSGLINGMCDLGNIALHAGDYSKAEKFYEQSLATCRAHGLKPDHNPLFCLGLLALFQNHYPSARQRFFAMFQSAEGILDTSDVRDLLVGFSAIAAGISQDERAAKLYGALLGITDSTGYRYPRFRQTEFDRHVKLAKDRLGENDFERLANEGRIMTIDQAITYALETQVE